MAEYRSAACHIQFTIALLEQADHSGIWGIASALSTLMSVRIAVRV
jgi:hypothetical protein